MLERPISVGASFTGLIVTLNVSETVKPLDVPVMVMLAEPCLLSKKSNVRLLPEIEAVTFEEPSFAVTDLVISLLLLSTSLNTFERSIIELEASSETVILLIWFATLGASSTG